MSKGMLHHVEIYVAGIKNTVDFLGCFLEELGYMLFQDWDHGQSWKIGDTYIIFVQSEDRFLEIPYHRCRPGLNHLAFHARSRQYVDEITYKLKEKGIHILYQEDHPFAGGDNHYAVYFEDPDNMKVELVAPE